MPGQFRWRPVYYTCALIPLTSESWSPQPQYVHSNVFIATLRDNGTWKPSKSRQWIKHRSNCLSPCLNRAGSVAINGTIKWLYIVPFLGQTGRGGGIVAISTHVPEASTHWRLSSPRSSYFQVWSWVQFSDIQGTAILEGSLDSFRSLPGTTFKHLSCYLFPDRVPRTPDQGPFSFHVNDGSVLFWLPGALPTVVPSSAFTTQLRAPRYLF